MKPAGDRARIPALDALRGVLALAVVAHHILDHFGIDIFQGLANFAVIAFFIMSGLVLARSYDDRPLTFLLRRIIRLWPTYAVCTVASFALIGQLPVLGDLFWWPHSPFNFLALPNRPAWTLYVEMWMTPVLVILFYLAKCGQRIAWLVVIAMLAFATIDFRLFVVPLFALGVALAGTDILWPQKIPAWSLWLGKLSYSLYISHWVVISAAVWAFGLKGVLVALPAIFVVAWALWRWVERPSIAMSRRIGAQPIAPPPINVQGA